MQGRRLQAAGCRLQAAELVTRGEGNLSGKTRENPGMGWTGRGGGSPLADVARDGDRPLVGTRGSVSALGRSACWHARLVRVARFRITAAGWPPLELDPPGFEISTAGRSRSVQPIDAPSVPLRDRKLKRGKAETRKWVAGHGGTKARRHEGHEGGGWGPQGASGWNELGGWKLKPLEFWIGGGLGRLSPGAWVLSGSRS